MNLEEMLNDHTSDILNAFCNFLKKTITESRITPTGLDLSPPSNRKADRIAWIRECMQYRPLMEHLYNDRMTDIERSAMQETVHSADNRFDGMRFEAKYGSIPNTVFSRYPRYRSAEGPPTFPSLALFIDGNRTMPPELVDFLTAFIPKPQELKKKTMASLPETVEIDGYGQDDIAPLTRHETEQTALNDLMAVLLLVDKGKVAVGAKTGKPTKAAAENILKILMSGDFYPPECEAAHRWDVQMGPLGIRPFAWTMLLQAGGLAKINGTKLALTRLGKTALKKRPQETMARLWDRWLRSNLTHEMRRIEIIKGQTSRKRPLYVAAPCRQSIAGALMELEESEWVRIDDFFKMLIANGHDFSLVKNPWALYLGEANYGSFGYNHVGWNHIEGRFARVFLLEYTATLGLIDVALVEPWNALNDLSDFWGADDISCLSRYDGLWAIRLTAIGAWILGKKDAYEPAICNEAVLRILPNMEITLLSETTASSDALFLDRFCKKISERVWRIEMMKLLQAVEEGVDIQSIVDFLASRNPWDLPQPVVIFFEDARKRAKSLRDMGDARLIECSDRALALLIANDVKLKKICMLAGDNYVVVPKGKEKLFRKNLRQLGYAVTL